MLAEQLVDANSDRYATAFNFGPSPCNDADVLQVAQTVADLWGYQARVETIGGPHLPEAALLRLDATKASRLLNWQVRWNITQALEQAVEWYKAWHEGSDVRPIMIRQLADFSAAAGK
jgi:CDP-glucose 4,6-dehydratase